MNSRTICDWVGRPPIPATLHSEPDDLAARTICARRSPPSGERLAGASVTGGTSPHPRKSAYFGVARPLHMTPPEGVRASLHTASREETNGADEFHQA